MSKFLKILAVVFAAGVVYVAFLETELSCNQNYEDDSRNA